jgi:TatD DNase family protein
VVDSHCHLADPAFAEDLPDVVARARAAGLTSALCILSADEPDEVARHATVRAAWPEVRFAAGVHPHRAGRTPGEAAGAVAATREAMARVDGAAVGEIGLDYHYDFSPRDVQQTVFAAQVELALELDLPVVIHTREATDDTHAVLRDAGHGRVRGVMHCFTGTVEEARRALDIDFYVSLAGIVTFPRADSLREVARFVPADRLLVETDAPYLAPVPYRGKRNEPAWVAETTARVAEVRRLTTAALGDETAANFAILIGAVGAPQGPSPGEVSR